MRIARNKKWKLCVVSAAVCLSVCLSVCVDAVTHYARQRSRYGTATNTRSVRLRERSARCTTGHLSLRSALQPAASAACIWCYRGACGVCLHNGDRSSAQWRWQQRWSKRCRVLISHDGRGVRSVYRSVPECRPRAPAARTTAAEQQQQQQQPQQQQHQYEYR